MAWRLISEGNKLSPPLADSKLSITRQRLLSMVDYGVALKRGFFKPNPTESLSLEDSSFNKHLLNPEN